MSFVDDPKPEADGAPSLCDLIRAVACANSERELNDALFDLHETAWPILRPKIAWGLAQRRVVGLAASLDEPEDIYNLLLQRVADGAKGLRSTNDGAIRKWLTTTVQRLIEDAVKKARRQQQRWRFLERLWRELWGHQFHPKNSEQERDDDGHED